MSEKKLFDYSASPTPGKKPGSFAGDPPGKRTALGFYDGRWDYPSSVGLGIDRVRYSRRNPHPQEHDPLPITIKMRDLPHLIVRDLKDASRAGELREELGRHIGLLEKGQLADPGTLKVLREYKGDLTGHPGADAEQLDVISEVVLSCGPRPA